jgi:hypothetical protein
MGGVVTIKNPHGLTPFIVKMSNAMRQAETDHESIAEPLLAASILRKHRVVFRRKE